MNFTPNKPTRPDEPNAVSHATSMVDLSLASIPEDGENFTAMLKTVKQSIDHSITSTSANTAAPLLSPNSEVLDEMNDKLYRYNRAQHKAEQAREDEERFERFKEPLNSLASFVYNIRIEVNPDTIGKPERTFDIIGDLSVRGFGEKNVTTYVKSVKIPKHTKIEYAAFDGMVDSVADYFPNLIETEESKRIQIIARDVMSVANKLFPPAERDDDSGSDLTLEQLEQDFDFPRSRRNSLS